MEMETTFLNDRAANVAHGLCQGNATHVLEMARTTWSTAGFDAAGVEWLDRHIETSRPHLTNDLVDEFVQLMGSFYGQCLLATFGGHWTLADGKLALWMDPHGITYPFEAVRRQVSRVDAPSVLARYTAAVSALSFAAA